MTAIPAARVNPVGWALLPHILVGERPPAAPIVSGFLPRRNNVGRAAAPAAGRRAQQPGTAGHSDAAPALLGTQQVRAMLVAVRGVAAQECDD